MKANIINPVNNIVKGSLKGFDAELEDVALPELVQFVCLERKDRELRVRSGLKEGVIFFEKGEIVHAQTGPITGEQAFYEIVSWPNGSLTLSYASTKQKTIDLPWNFLIMEAARKADEQEAAPETTAAPAQDSCKVLIIDYSELFRKELAKTFSGFGKAEVIASVSNGERALEIIENEKPDLITLDINMPIIGGDRALRQLMVKSPAPVLLISPLTAHSFRNVMDFMRLGALDFIPKPDSLEKKEKFIQRLRACVEHFDEFQVEGIRRARAPKPVILKARPGMAAEKLLLINGGWGGLLELFKIIPSFAKARSVSAVMYLDIYPDLLQPLAQYMDSATIPAVNPLLAGGPLLEFQFWISRAGQPLEVIEDFDGRAIKLKKGKHSHSFSQLAQSAVEVFGDKLCVMFVSGAEDIDVETAEILKISGANLFVQDPATAMHPKPLEELKRKLYSYSEVLSCEEICSYCQKASEE